MRIVVADSNRLDREAVVNIVRSICGKSKYEIVGTASNGREGFEKIVSLRPDLLIVDIQLTGMNGLSLIKKVREEQIPCRVIVYTADMDFKRVQKAIQLDVDDYQLKPVRKQKLQKALKHIEEKLKEEQAVKEALSEESIFMSCLNGQIISGESLHNATREKYGFAVSDPGAICVVWLGSGYMQHRENVQEMLEKSGRGKDFSVCVLRVDAWHILVTVVYRKKYEDSAQEDCTDGGDFRGEYEIFRDRIVPGLCGSINSEIVCMWAQAERMQDFLTAIRELRRMREWNLLFDRGDLIRIEDIEHLKIVPMKYPATLENQVRQAVLSSDGEEIKKCFYRLYDFFRREPYEPREIKECMIRFNMAILGAYKTGHEVRSEVGIQSSLHKIAEAMSWGEIRAAMDEFFRNIDQEAFSEGKEGSLSPLVRKAMEMARKYYDQGIRLEEIARELFVSEEYLSTLFKRETGTGFAETIRRMRIDRIKGLLANTRLKVSQIAELTGYNDPKYMSRVFKEEVGMLPTEFRKSVH